MPTYEIDSPDGKTYEIEGPASATKEQLVQALMYKLYPPTTPEKPPSAGAVFGKSLLTGSVPALAGLKGFAEAAAPFAELGPVAIIPGLIGGAGSAYLAEKAQNKILESTGLDKKLGVDEETMAKGAAAHPIAQAAGDFAAQLETMKPSLKGLQSVKGLSEALAEEVWHARKAAAANAAIGAVTNAAQQGMFNDGNVDWKSVAESAAMGAILQSPNKFGRYVEEFGHGASTPKITPPKTEVPQTEVPQTSGISDTTKLLQPDLFDQQGGIQAELPLGPPPAKPEAPPEASVPFKEPAPYIPDIGEQRSLDFNEIQQQQNLPLLQEVKAPGELFGKYEPLPDKQEQALYPQPQSDVPQGTESSGQYSLFDLPKTSMQDLAPRDRVLRAMQISEDVKTVKNLEFATGLKPLEVRAELNKLKNENILYYNASEHEWQFLKKPYELEGPPQPPEAPEGSPLHQDFVGPSRLPESVEPIVGEKADVQNNIKQQLSDRVVERGVAGSLELPIQQRGAEPTGTVEPERGAVGSTEPSPSVSDVGKEAVNDSLKPAEAEETVTHPENDVEAGRTGSSTVEDVQNQIRDDFGIHGDRLLSSGKVTVVPDVDSLPPRDDGQAHPEGTRGAVIGDKAYIVAGNIGTGEAKDVMLHEVGAHIGLEQMLPADHYQRLLNDVDTRTKRGEGPFVEARNRAESVVDANDPNRADTVRRETLAYLVENRPDLPFVKRLLSQVKVALNNWSGGRLFNLNADDLRTAAIAALKRVSSAEAAADPNSFYRKNNTPISYSQAAKDTVTRIDDAVRINLPEPNHNILTQGRDIFFNMSKGSLPDSLVQGVNSFLSTRDFKMFYEDKVPALKQLNTLMNEIANGFRSGKKEINDNMNRWIKDTSEPTLFGLMKKSKFSREEWKQFHDISLATTINQVEVLNTPERKLDDGAVIAARKVEPKNASERKLVDDFNKLPPELKKLYAEMRDEYDADSHRFLGLLTKNASGSEMEAVRKRLESARLKVYLPIYRRGNYWMSFEDAEGQAYRMAFKSFAEREQAYRNAQQQGAVGLTKYRNLEDLIERDRGTPPTGLLGDIMKIVGTEDKGMLDAIYKTYLDYLPAASLRQRFRGRSELKYLGMESDIVQAYGHVGTAMKNALNKLKYAEPLSNALNDVKGQVQSSKPEDKERLQQMYASLSKQVDFFNNPYYNNLVSKAGWYSYIWDLAGNASSAFVASTHMPMMVIPRLGAKYGYEQVMQAMFNAGKDFKMTMGEDGHTSMPKNLSSLTQRAIREGALGYHVGQELFDIRQAPIADYTGLKSKVMNGLNYMMQTTDRFNRELTLRTAYDLELNKMGTTHEKATAEQRAAAEEVAIDETTRAFGSAYTELGPSITKSAIGRLAFTFKRFQLVRMMNLADTFNKVFSNPSSDMQVTLDKMIADRRPEAEINAYKEQMKNVSDYHASVREMARKQLLGYYGLAFAFAGVAGMPLVGGAKFLAQLLSDEFTDTPRDINAELNEVMGDYAWKGPMNKILGVELASRTGWNDMFWKDEPSNASEQTAFGYLGERAFGPIYSMATKSWHGLQLFKDGQFERGLEMMAPVAITNNMKAMRYAMEGAKTESGKPIVDDVNDYNAFMQALGFAPADVAEAREKAGNMSAFQKKLDAQRNSVLSKVYAASEIGNPEDIDDAYKKVDAFNEAFPDNPITGKQIARHIKQIHERESTAINGFTPKKQWRSTLESEYGED